jgi:uncharacterized SAM-binding protein YcdF (DUF218 family)
VARLIPSVISASGPIVGLVAAALWLWRRPHSSGARRTLVTIVLAYAAAAVYLVPYTVGRLLVIGYHPFAASDLASNVGESVAVVVLGSGDELVDGWNDRLVVTTPIEGARVLETARVFHLIAPEWVIASGGSGPIGRGPPSAMTMQDELERLGVPGARIAIEAQSRTTHDEAVILAPMLRDLRVRQLVIVTSDIHMRRSLGAFRAVGWSAVPAIAPDPRSPSRRIEWVLPTPIGLELSRDVAHEFVGLVYYWIRGWWR